MRLLTRRTMPCAALSPRPLVGGWKGMPYRCSLPRRHDSDHEARLFGQTVQRWPRRAGR